jgi:thiol-disulfide isomerase/thioredoxin
MTRRPNRREWRRGFVVFGLGMIALVAVVLLVHPQPPLLATGAAAPPVVLRDATGVSDDVFGSAGHHAVVIHFFAVGCTNCRRQLPALCGLARDYPSAVVVGIDASREAAAAVLAYAQRYQPPGCAVRLLIDPGAKVSQTYAITVVPTAYVVDGNGKIVGAGFGASAVDGAAHALRRLLHG